MRMRVLTLLMMMMTPSLASAAGAVRRLSSAQLRLCNSLHKDAVRCAQEEAERFGAKLGLMRAMRVKLTDEPPTPTSTEWAWARRDDYPYSDGCLLTFMPTTISRSQTIAHEVCHCRYDWKVLSSDGTITMVPSERAEMEARANECADWVSGEAEGSIVDRMLGRVPSFGKSETGRRARAGKSESTATTSPAAPADVVVGPQRPSPTPMQYERMPNGMYRPRQRTRNPILDSYLRSKGIDPDKVQGGSGGDAE